MNSKISAIFNEYICCLKSIKYDEYHKKIILPSPSPTPSATICDGDRVLENIVVPEILNSFDFLKIFFKELIVLCKNMFVCGLTGFVLRERSICWSGSL